MLRLSLLLLCIYIGLVECANQIRCNQKGNEKADELTAQLFMFATNRQFPSTNDQLTKHCR